jgi:acetamidase/formamidase
MKYSFIISCFLYSNLLNSQVNAGNTKDLEKPGIIIFKPTFFSNKFSLNVTPALRIHSGDTICTETIDAFGKDRDGIKRQGGGNPLTGPFYIENSEPNDVLKIELIKVSLNRQYAFTTETFVGRSMPDSIVKQFSKKPHIVKWKLDIENGIASPDSSFSIYENLKNFKVPIKSFIGCIGVAPQNKRNEILSFFQGDFGGNLDFNKIEESTIIYLPVFHQGAYLYVGDGHAVQGDGEIAGNALETSLDVVFTVQLIRSNILKIKNPVLEDSIYFMSIGSGKTLENALQIASSGLLEWLKNIYHLTLGEATQVLSTTIEYTIAEIADPNVTVVAGIKKKLLNGLRRK